MGSVRQVFSRQVQERRANQTLLMVWYIVVDMKKGDKIQIL